MGIAAVFPPEKSRLRALLDHFAIIDDPREQWRVAHLLPEVLLLVVCGTVADCDDFEGIAEWGEAHFGIPAPVPALTSRCSRLAVAEHSDEPDRPGTILDSVHELGAGELA